MGGDTYIFKLKAFLHDPIHKIYAFDKEKVKEGDIYHEELVKQYKEYIQNIQKKQYKKYKQYKGPKTWHEVVAHDLFYFILEDTLKEDVIEDADKISSGLSRIIVNENENEKKSSDKTDDKTKVFIEEAYYIDPFNLKKEKPIGQPKSHKEVKEVFEKLGDLTFSNQEERAKFTFLFLWRFIPDIFPWVNKHPADSRAPNHSIYDHLVQTSAITTCLQNKNKPAFLLFTLTPVQSFIATARKTSDLWAGSYLLSYIIYKAIEKIVEELGPDHIVFPNLRSQPLCDFWLYEKYFKHISVDIKEFEDWKSALKDNKFTEKLKIANFPNRFLALVPSSKAIDIGKKCESSVGEVIDEIIKDIDKIIKIDTSVKDAIKNHLLSYLKTYWVVVPFYDKNYYDIDTLLAEYKNLVGENELIQTIEIIKANPSYNKANVGSAYHLLVELAEKFLASRKMVRDFKVIPHQPGEKCHLCGEYDILPIDDWSSLSPYYVRKSERLCGLCLTKRFLPKIMKNKFNLKEDIRFPSTSEMATVSYKRSIKDELKEEFRENFNNVFNSNNKNSSVSVPGLKGDTEKNAIYTTITTVSVPGLKGDKLYDIDGQWLIESSYRKEYIEKEYGLNVDESKLEEMKEFLRKNKISPPTYYAILAVDGDRIGNWLNGSFMPEVKNLIHEKVVSRIDESNNDNIKKLLGYKHPMSPSFHHQFSRILSEFALDKVKDIVEDKHLGKVIYAGGDDVLAFLPVEKAIDCAENLNQSFKDLLGEKGSMSAGIVFVHHKYPLSLALNEVRDAEKLAKNIYGRNAFCVKYISGSGESRVTGMKWENKNFIDKLVEKYEKDDLPSKFAYDFVKIVKELVPYKERNIKDDIHEVIKNELRRIYRHKLNQGKYDKTFEDELLGKLDMFKGNYMDFADMLVISRFISTISSRKMT